MKIMKLVLLVMCFSCTENTEYKSHLDDPQLFNATMKQLTDVMVHDIFSPPVAARIYVYPSIAAYEAILPGYLDKYQSLSGQLNGLTPAPKPENEDINFHLAALKAFLVVGKTLIFSEEKIELYTKNIYDQLKNEGIPSATFKNSLAYGEIVADHILNWAAEDMYKQSRTYPKYTLQQNNNTWHPTPPDYMEGIEPHWTKIRTMVLDSSGQFPPVPPLEVNLDESSEFYRQLKEVQDIGDNLNEERTEIAKFWDCNPYVSHHQGHAMFATKKITPGGHWIGITAIAASKAGSTFDETIEVHAKVSIALFDAFISCWHEKWRSIVIRPETLINQHLDEDWLPLLQTPPFPEYTSGHSVISRAAAVVLTDYYGDDFSFNDTSELEFGLTERYFNSFLEASEEAAISRIYGGIHYMMAIEYGVDQGQMVGDYIVTSLNTRIQNLDSADIVLSGY